MIALKFLNWNCYLRFGKYSNDRIAIQLFDVEDHAPVCKATVNLPDMPLPPGYIFIKDYAENEGILETLIEAGVINEPEGLVPSGHACVHMCKLNVDPETA